MNYIYIIKSIVWDCINHQMQIFRKKGDPVTMEALGVLACLLLGNGLYCCLYCWSWHFYCKPLPQWAVKA